jgi:Phage tail protein (Tail_P2_I)
MADLQLQPSVNDLRGQALLQLLQWLKSLNLTSILVYIIQSLNDTAVLPMAWQWDVLNPLLAAGLTGAEQIQIASWDTITDIDTLTNIDLLSEIEQSEESGQPSFDAQTYRVLILLSTALHSTIGTPAALQSALSNLGFPNAQILEGQNSWGGTQYPNDQGWAVFRVNISLASVTAAITQAAVQTLVAACNFWKPAMPA